MLEFSQGALALEGGVFSDVALEIYLDLRFVFLSC